MITVQIDCGLGNQMFEYAAARAAASRSGVPLRIDANKYRFTSVRRYELADFPAIDEPLAAAGEYPLLYSRTPWWTLLRRIAKKRPDGRAARFGFRERMIREADGGEALLSLDLEEDCYVVGFWQSERYFADFRDEVRRRFAFPPPVDPRSAALLEQLRSDDRCVSIHVRRGDYSEDADIARAMGGICTTDYYRRAIDRARQAVPDARFVVFSDGMDYARTQLGLPAESIFVDWNGGGRSCDDMNLMAACSHHIIANSTFSWWGAYLGRNPERRVFAPEFWSNGVRCETIKILPESWTVIA